MKRFSIQNLVTSELRTPSGVHFTFCIIVCYTFLISSALAGWEAGVARGDITPEVSVPLAGYGGKTRMSVKVDHPIWVKALALKDESGAISVIATADLVGLSDKMVARIAKDALEHHGIERERLVLNYSHNHSCPVTEDVLWLYYELTPEEVAVRDDYTQKVYRAYDEAIGKAVATLAPAELAFEQGLAGVAVNRRRARPEGRKLGGQVDQDVPVLTVRSGDTLRAVLFGYSCHTTALGGLSINGDYAGFAQVELEKWYSGTIAMFMQNCGGDANPLPRIRGRDVEAVELASMYGKILAEAVRQVVDGKMQVLKGPLRVSMGETELMLEEGLSLEELRRRVSNLSGMPRREFEHFIRQYETLGGLPDRVKYPVQVWRLGNGQESDSSSGPGSGSGLTWIFLTGETVVDYSLKFKAMYGWDNTWVAGYNNDLLSYVPSLRVLKEGSYEGLTGMFEYGHRGPYAADVEERITAKVGELVKRVTE